MTTDEKKKLILLKVIAISTVGVVTAVAVYRRRQRTMIEKKPVPRLSLTKSGRFDKLENFASYVVRQLGFSDLDECPQIGKLAYDHLMKTKGSEDNIFAYFSTYSDAEKLYEGLVDEFDKCILSYFAFHWTHASVMVSEVLNVNSVNKKRLKDLILAATRKQRFERVTRDLKVTRVFSTLLEEMKAIRKSPGDDTKCTDVMVPVALSERSPVLLLMGGGMGAGKSTVLKDILKESFWSEAAENAVVVEADAFKETDVIYRALSSSHDMLQTAELVHQSSTDAASSLLVTALNEGRDVIMDGTLSWEPFVEQTIAMARNVHRRRYRMGIGYKVADDGTITENYWEQVEEGEEDKTNKKKPYRIELVGVVCDAYLAVVRGIRRAILMGRAVRVKSQLTSHKRFANAFSRYCPLVDNARLYSTNAMGGPPKLIGWKDGENQLLVDQEEIDCLTRLCTLNENADSVHELYPNAGTVPVLSSTWYEAVSTSGRENLQKELKMVILKIENEKLGVTEAS